MTATMDYMVHVRILHNLRTFCFAPLLFLFFIHPSIFCAYWSTYLLCRWPDNDPYHQCYSCILRGTSCSYCWTWPALCTGWTAATSPASAVDIQKKLVYRFSFLFHSVLLLCEWQLVGVLITAKHLSTVETNSTFRTHPLFALAVHLLWVLATF